MILATLGPTPSREPEQDPLETFQKMWPKQNEESLARRSWHPKIDPGPGQIPELSLRIKAMIPGPAPALEAPLRAFLNSWPKQNSKGPNRFEEGQELDPTLDVSPSQDAAEENLWPIQQLARAFWELPAALNSLKTQEHPPTN